MWHAWRACRTRPCRGCSTGIRTCGSRRATGCARPSPSWATGRTGRRKPWSRAVRRGPAGGGCRPKRAAKALVTGRSQVLGVVAQNSTLYGPASLLVAFEHAAAEAGFTVSVGNVSVLDRHSIGRAVEQHLDQRVAGIVVIAPVASANEALDHLPADVPLVTIDGDPSRPAALVT